MATVGGKFTGRWTCLGSPLNSASSQPKSAHMSRMICSMRSRCRELNTWCRYLVTKTTWACMMKHSAENTVSASTDVTDIGHEVKYALGVQLRYNYRLYPAPAQRAALARAFGCARVVFNDGLWARQQAREAGRRYVTDADLSAWLTAAKKTPERQWLGEVSAVVLQQALADLSAAYRNFFASVKGERKSGRAGPPRLRSRKDRRQAIRFTANARFTVLAERAAAAAEDRGCCGAVVAAAAVPAVQRHGHPGRGGPVLRVVRGRDRPGC